MSLDAHTTHCCARHGCKYNDSDCPVKRGIYPQKGPCEDCRTSADQAVPKLLFGVVVKQAGRGCDHSIDCGTRFEPLKATTLADALVEAREYVQGKKDPSYACGFAETKLEADYNHNGRPVRNLKGAALVVLQEELPIETWYLEVQAERDRIKATSEKAEAEAELQRLAAMLGKRVV